MKALAALEALTFNANGQSVYREHRHIEAAQCKNKRKAKQSEITAFLTSTAPAIPPVANFI